MCGDMLKKSRLWGTFALHQQPSIYLKTMTLILGPLHLTDFDHEGASREMEAFGRQLATQFAAKPRQSAVDELGALFETPPQTVAD
jgi:hypothetical protein